MIKLRVTELGAVRDWPTGSITVDFIDQLRGESAMRLSEDDARLLWASLKDIARKQRWDADD